MKKLLICLEWNIKIIHKYFFLCSPLILKTDLKNTNIPKLIQLKLLFLPQKNITKSNII